MIEQYGVYIELAGVALMVIGWLWMAARAFRHRIAWGLFVLFCPPAAPFYGLWRSKFTWAPLIVLGLGLVVTAAPPVYSLLAPIDLGPRDRMVAGERHLTLTGWDRKDYSALAQRPDVVVLQMANPDVTDETLTYLKGLDRLKELDLDNTKITDEGLKILKDLPALAFLRLKNTKITDAGFTGSLAAKESLQRLDLTGTQVDRETVETWRKAKAGRRAMQ
ncbi:MAG: hypothetical protein P4L85_20280 [Paludisphaera borealis]|uniref:hypothetical protein n=1 Tax=Paludisphaera borealis TaxID=1387353 RepID=UPI00283C04CE|nr:hypothetical protein [Paludisphaera borealis]MDR3621701.1 hypothetical protein [Paludisphaera borealis]